MSWRSAHLAQVSCRSPMAARDSAVNHSFTILNLSLRTFAVAAITIIRRKEDDGLNR